MAGRFIDPMQGMKRIDTQHRYLPGESADDLRTAIDVVMALLTGSDGSDVPAVIAGGEGLRAVTDPETGEVTGYEVPQIAVYYDGVFYDNTPEGWTGGAVETLTPEEAEGAHVVMWPDPSQPSGGNGSRGWRKLVVEVTQDDVVVAPVGTEVFTLETADETTSEGDTGAEDGTGMEGSGTGQGCQCCRCRRCQGTSKRK